MATSVVNRDPSTTPALRRLPRSWPLARLAGLAGLLFVITVIGQNIGRMAISPANDASVESIVSHYQDDRGLYAALGASFAVGGLALALFIAGVVARATDKEERVWAGMSLLGAAGVMALFSGMVATEFALLVATDKASPTPAVVETIWILHNAIFAVLHTVLAVALLGVSRTAVASRLIPPVLGRVAPFGAALLLVGTLAGPQLAAGELQPLSGLAGIGFLVWLAVVASASVGLIRSDDEPA